jgi:hypothetical protein
MHTLRTYVHTYIHLQNYAAFHPRKQQLETSGLHQGVMADPCERGNEEFREMQTVSLSTERLLISHEWLRSIELAHLFQICVCALGAAPLM